MSDRLVLAFCRLGFAGCSKIMPGTCGTLVAVLIAPFLFLPLGLVGRLLLLCAVFVAGGIAATRGEVILGKTDPGEIVIDELAGVWIAMLPFAGPDFTMMALAFFLFRVFDMAKPWPINVSEHWMPAGWGIMIDDVVGGVITMIVLVALKLIGFVELSWCWG